MEGAGAGERRLIGTAGGPESAVPGLSRSDPRGPGISRERAGTSWRYLDAAGADVTDAETLGRIRALAVPPAWTSVWISADPLGHIQATGTDSRGRTQYRYHQLWREQRDQQKFAHMLNFAAALPDLRTATLHDLHRRELDRDRVTATAVRLIDLGLFRLGGERYAELDHHYGAVTLEKRHVSLHRGSATFDYVAKEGKERTITVTDQPVLSALRALARSGSSLDALFSFPAGATWRPLRSHDVSGYIAAHAGGHFTAKEFRTWNATVLMALLLADAGPAASDRAAKSVINASVRGVAEWLGDTPTVARASYIDPRITDRYLAAHSLAGLPVFPARLPAGLEAEGAVGALLSS